MFTLFFVEISYFLDISRRIDIFLLKTTGLIFKVYKVRRTRSGELVFRGFSAKKGNLMKLNKNEVLTQKKKMSKNKHTNGSFFLINPGSKCLQGIFKFAMYVFGSILRTLQRIPCVHFSSVALHMS
jgi:hypothetical protein